MILRKVWENNVQGNFNTADMPLTGFHFFRGEESIYQCENTKDMQYYFDSIRLKDGVDDVIIKKVNTHL